MFRFLHSSDLHIGRRFGNLPEELRGRLREARHDAIARLAEQARANGAPTILLAGDMFDTETPTPAMLRQALAEMAEDKGLSWVILPGNHDSLQADELWRAMRAHAPQNVTLAVEAAPLEPAPGVTLLPAPCTTRRPGRDLTDWMVAAESAEGAIRIGLAHGAIRSFSEDGGTEDVIAPDRARRAGLDYLALGDWHGQLSIDERTFYSGTPEPDRFKHSAPGSALLVSVEAPGAVPSVVPVRTERFSWTTIALDLLAEDAAAEVLTARLPQAGRRSTLLRVVASGRVRLAEHAALGAAMGAAAPEFAHAVLDEAGLATECEASDLDRIDRAGALRQAADALLAESADETRAAGERETARAALTRLFSYCEASAP